MVKPLSFGKVDITVQATLSSLGTALEPDTPFHICVLGDFSHRTRHSTGQQTRSLAQRRPVFIDRDNFAEVMAQLNVAIHLPLCTEPDSSISLAFSALEDFHPDQLLDRVDVLRRSTAHIPPTCNVRRSLCVAESVSCSDELGTHTL